MVQVSIEVRRHLRNKAKGESVHVLHITIGSLGQHETMIHLAKIESHYQGKTVAEFVNGDWFVMTPDGQVHIANNKASVERIAFRWFKKHSDKAKFNIGEIKWRKPCT